LSERVWRHSHIFFKQIDKVIDIVKTDKAADRLDIHVRGQQHFFCCPQALFVQIAQRRLTEVRGKLAAQAVFADAVALLINVQ